MPNGEKQLPGAGSLSGTLQRLGKRASPQLLTGQPHDPVCGHCVFCRAVNGGQDLVEVAAETVLAELPTGKPGGVPDCSGDELAPVAQPVHTLTSSDTW